MRTLNSLLAALVLSTATLAGCAAGGSDDSIGQSDDESTLPGSFDLWQSADGWHFHLAAGNKQILLASESYTSRTAALNGVLAVINNGVDPSQYQVLPAAHGYMLLGTFLSPVRNIRRTSGARRPSRDGPAC